MHLSTGARIAVAAAWLVAATIAAASVTAYFGSDDGLDRLGLIVIGLTLGLPALALFCVLADALLDRRRWAPRVGLVAGIFVTLVGVNAVGGALRYGAGGVPQVTADLALLASGLALLLPLSSSRVRRELADGEGSL